MKMRPGTYLGPLLLLIFVSLLWRFRDVRSASDYGHGGARPSTSGGGTAPGNGNGVGDLTSKPPPVADTTAHDHDHNQKPSEQKKPAWNAEDTHHEIFSLSTPDKKYFHIVFGDQLAINPNIIPHPHFNDTWIIVAQLHNQREVPNSVFFSELVCTAKFIDGLLQCDHATAILPIAATFGDKCVGEWRMFGFSIGPHDARVFYGPKVPYSIYGSLSRFSCFGQFIQDFRMLTDWGLEFGSSNFHKPTEIQRPGSYGFVEKNWFVFWDKEGEMYAHYDVAPKRAFAKLAASPGDDGSVGEDLALVSAEHDKKCMERYMPKAPLAGMHLEDIHQATNSLSITLCKRSDKTCQVTDDNTFIMIIFHHKTFFNFHGVYNPYVMLFRRTAPFEVHGITQKPLWIHGRGIPGEIPPAYLADEAKKAWNDTQMFFTTSMSWKQQHQKYHGYVDDVLFVAFGIEDSDTGAIDVHAGDILETLALCSTP